MKKPPKISFSAGRENAIKGIQSFQANMALKFPPGYFQQFAEISRGLQKALAPFRKQFAEALRNWPTPEEMEVRDREDLTELANQGWFISLMETDITILHRTAALFRHGEPVKAEKLIADHFREISEQVERDVIEACPHRKGILSKAFSAHRSGDYELSVPTMLCQTEGIGTEIFEASIHSKKSQEKHRIQTKFDALDPHQFMVNFYGLLTVDLAIRAKTGDAEVERARLNRHAVLHGINYEYASEINSLKAISWLYFISQFKTYDWMFFQAERERVDRDDAEADGSEEPT